MISSSHRGRTVAVGLFVLFVLVFWTIPSAIAQVDRGNLVVTGSPTPEPAGSGVPVTYTVNVKNDSTHTATGVLVTMDPPDGAQFVRCTPAAQVCQQSPAGMVTTTFATVQAHKTVKVNLVLQMPTVTQDTTLNLAILAHADNAIGGEEPRDGTFTMSSTVLPPATRLLMSPSGRIVMVACGAVINSTTFGADTEGQMLDGIVCGNGSGLTFTASGKTLNLGGKRIYSGNRVVGNAGINVGPNAVNVTIKGGGTEGTKGIEQFEYCIKDLGGNTGLYITGLRCFRAKSVGILTVSNGVVIENSLVDNTVPDSKSQANPAGVGIQVGGDNVHVKDTKVRRSATIGFWAYGIDADGSGLVSTYDGNTITSRIEGNAGIGAVLAGGPHKIKGTQVQAADPTDPPTNIPKDGIVVEGTAVGSIIEEVVIKSHLGNAIQVDAGATGTVIARTNVEEIGGSGFVIDAPSTLSGNSAKLVVGDAFVINAAAVVTTNSVEECSGNAFVINAGAVVDSNSANDNGGYGFVVTNAAPSSMGPDWSIQGVGDFDGNGGADILWRHTSGTLSMWLSSGPGPSRTISLGTVGTEWTIAGVADVNGDGKDDILWRHAAGGVFIWLMNGSAGASGSGAPGWLAPEWTVAGIGDFNGDGKADILWRHASGQLLMWLMNGVTASNTVPLGAVGTEWTASAVADFNGDGKADILWRHTVGVLFMWLMNGAAGASSTASLGTVSTEWAIAKVADFNGDGKADILWRHALGGPFIWLMNGAAGASATGAPGWLAPEWTVAGVGDFNRDGKADILWRHSSGVVATWFMNGTAVLTGSGAASALSNVAEGNALGGFLVSGTGNVLRGNSAKDNSGRGFSITGAGNALNTNAAERSAGAELVIAPNNVDQGSNSANGARFTFTAAGGTFE